MFEFSGARLNFVTKIHSSCKTRQGQDAALGSTQVRAFPWRRELNVSRDIPFDFE
jgi:hypothetical protein